MSETALVKCDYCYDEVDQLDTRTLPSGKVECYWCRYYERNKSGKYQTKRHLIPKFRPLYRCVDGGHWELIK